MEGNSAGAECVAPNSTTKLPPILCKTNYFRVIEIKDDGKILAKCLLCIAPKTISGSKAVSSNFNTHLQKVHAEEWKRFLDLKASEKDKDKDKDKDKTNSNWKPKKEQPTIPEMMMNKVGEKANQNQANELITNFVVNSIKPLSTVDDQDFKNLIHGLRPDIKVLSTKALKKRIKVRVETEKAEKIVMFESVDYVCISADIWSDRTRSFMGVTCHWIDSNLCRKSTVLSCHRFKGSHTYDKIGEILCDIFRKYGIGVENIVCVVTDNGSNFKKAFKYFGVQDIEEISDSENEEDEGFEYENIEFDFDSILQDIKLPRSHKCAAHTLSLVAAKDLSKSLPGDYKKILHPAMSKCSALWNKNAKPKSSEIIKEKCGIQLIYPGATRWNSLYDSISRILNDKVKPNLDFLCETFNLPKFKTKELEFLEEYKRINAPIAQGLDMLQGDNFMGVLLPTLLSIQSRLISLKSDPTIKYSVSYIELLLKGLNERFGLYLSLDKSKTNEILASISHPYFKIRWIPVEHFSRLKRLFLEEISKCDAATLNAQNLVEIPDNEFFSFPSAQNSQEVSENNSANKSELQCLSYFEEKSTDISILNQYPLVKKVFMKYNTAIPTSAPVERLFSFGGLILNKKRKNLTDETFEDLVMAKCARVIK